MKELSEMTIRELETLAKQAAYIARELEKEAPSYDLALEYGIVENSYKTVRCGMVSSYSGKVEIAMGNGSKWIATGHSPRGGSDYVESDGYIDFKKISD